MSANEEERGEASQPLLGWQRGEEDDSQGGERIYRVKRGERSKGKQEEKLRRKREREVGSKRGKGEKIP